jgi:hypothetical protein
LLLALERERNNNDDMTGGYIEVRPGGVESMQLYWLSDAKQPKHDGEGNHNDHGTGEQSPIHNVQCPAEYVAPAHGGPAFIVTATPSSAAHLWAMPLQREKPRWGGEPGLLASICSRLGVGCDARAVLWYWPMDLNQEEEKALSPPFCSGHIRSVNTIALSLVDSVASVEVRTSSIRANCSFSFLD